MKTKIKLNCNIYIPKGIINYLKNKEIRFIKNNKNNILLTEHSINAILDDKYFDDKIAVQVARNFIDLILQNRNRLFIFEVVGNLDLNNNKFVIEKIGLKFRFENLYINFIVRKVNTNYGIKYKVITVWCNHISDKHQTLRNKWRFYKDLDLFNKSNIKSIFFKFS